MWESRWSASTSARPELLTVLLHGGALARLVRAQCREISSQGNLAIRILFPAKFPRIGASWISSWPEENSCLREIIVESLVQDESNPPFCILRRLLFVLPFF